MLRLFYVLSIILVPAIAAATPPPTEEESWVCLVEGSVEEMAMVEETMYRKPDNFTYAPANKLSLTYQTVRLHVKSVSPNPASRMPENSCLKVQPTWTPPLPLCAKADIKLGDVVKGQLQRWYYTPGYDYCLKLG